MSLRGKKVSKSRLVLLACILVGLLIIVTLVVLLHGKTIPVLDPQGVVGKRQRDLIVFTLLLSIIVVVPVFTMLGLFAYKYREGASSKTRYTPDADGNRWLELFWWGIPIIIIAILGTVTVVSTHQLDPYKPLASNVPPLKVQVVAMQWKWLFLYPDQKIASVNELHIPAGTPVDFELTADGPMSGFWIPALGTQTYAMTGMTAKVSLQADKAGTYKGANSNISGKGYSDMAFNVVATPSRADFDSWVNGIVNMKGHHHLEWDEYEDMVKPATSAVEYLHLHDTGLFDEVLAKYMGDGHAMNGNMDMSAHDHEGGE